MSFLAPLFLLGLAALAIPVLLHLVQRERKRVVEFPSLMFLRKIPYQSVRRRRIQHWWLLFLRLAALLLIVAAFARPFLRGGDVSAAAATGARELVILLDHSYSMGYGDRWDRARRAAREAVQGLSAEDRGTLVLFATGAQIEVRASADRGPLISAIDAARVGSGATKFGPALKLAQSVLAESRLPRREVLLISDFQKIGWNQDEGVHLPEGTTLTPVPIADAKTSNLTLSSVNLQRTVFSGQERVIVTAGLVNRGETNVDGVEVSLELEGRAIQTERVAVEKGGGAATVTFAPFTLTASHTRGSVRSAADALVADNVLHFVVSPGEKIPVLVVERGNAARDASLYLTRALAIGSSPIFDVTVTTLDRVGGGDFEGRRMVVLNDVPIAQVALAERIAKFVRDGGGLLFVAGERGAWPAGAADVLPGAFGATIDGASGRGAALGVIDYSHPIFEPFKAPRSGDFSAPRFFRYRSLTPAEGATVLARFDDGTVALAERKVDKGRVLVWTSTLDTFWNDLTIKPVFLPFVHRVARHLTAFVETPPWRTVGQVVEPEAVRTPGRKAAARVAVTPSGAQVRLGEDNRTEVVELFEQGFYEIRTQGATAQRPPAIAANVDVGESDLTPVDPQELVAAIAGRGGTTAAGGADVTLTAAQTERRQSLWWYLLVAGVLLLGIENIIGNRLSRAPQ